MFKKARKETMTKDNLTGDAPTTVKYPKPKILIIDVEPRCAEVLKHAGYNVSIGSFGIPYKVKKSNRLHYVSQTSMNLPNIEEQEIIILNMLPPNSLDSPPDENPGEGIKVSWQTCTEGLIDPRPLNSLTIQDIFDKIYKHGGIFIVFTAPIIKTTYSYGNIEMLEIGREEDVEIVNWNFLSVLTAFQVNNNIGHEIKFLKDKNDIATLLLYGQEGAHYDCTLDPNIYIRERWIPLAENKYGEDVAGILIGEENSEGCIFFLPSMPNAYKYIVQLLEDYCSIINAQFFPDLQGNRWVHFPEYEIPRVLELEKEIENVKAESEQKVNCLQAKIEKIQEEKADWYTLLRGTGDELVQAVITSLKSLGFQQVVDVDAKTHEQDDKTELREDIQIHDKSPVLIVDVKGVQGHPDDDESRQSEKHAIMRIREWDRSDVQPLTIVNHQRHIPPHDRDQGAFRIEIIENAKQTGLGLMTTWDLFRLLRNTEMLSWPLKMVQPVFYRIGRIEPIPEHYEIVGQIVKVWKHAFGIIPNSAISVGNRLAVEVGDTFIELNIETMQVENESVEKASAGSSCGIAFNNESKVLKEGARVFLIFNDPTQL